MRRCNKINGWSDLIFFSKTGFYEPIGSFTCGLQPAVNSYLFLQRKVKSHTCRSSHHRYPSLWLPDGEIRPSEKIVYLSSQKLRGYLHLIQGAEKIFCIVLQLDWELL